MIETSADSRRTFQQIRAEIYNGDKLGFGTLSRSELIVRLVFSSLPSVVINVPFCTGIDAPRQRCSMWKIRERNRNNPKETVRDRQRIQNQKEKFTRRTNYQETDTKQKKTQKRKCPFAQQKICIDFSSVKT